MTIKFPYGRAPFWLLVIALVATSVRFVVARRRPPRADLVLVTFTRVHKKAYDDALPEFQRRFGVRVEVQLSDWLPLQTRLQNALLAGTETPDLAEVLGEGSLGFFTRGPREDIGVLDLTDRLDGEGWTKRLVPSRLSIWTARGRIYAVPHDVHPMMLAYRRDLMEKLGIDVRELDTWDKFTAVGRRVTRDDNGDGVPDRYMIDLPYEGNQGLTLLLLQHGGHLFDAEGRAAFASPQGADVIRFYIHLHAGPGRIAFDCGDEQIMIKALLDGLVLFFPCPDWRTANFEELAPSLAGKMALMPMPAWEKGGRRTTTWGGTGLMIMKGTKNPDLAWELAKFLYFDPKSLGRRFTNTGIIPPLEDAWSLPEMSKPNPFFSNLPVGKMYIELAPETPPDYTSPVDRLARLKLNEAYGRSLLYYKSHGDDGLEAQIRADLARAAAEVDKMTTRVNALVTRKD